MLAVPIHTGRASNARVFGTKCCYSSGAQREREREKVGEKEKDNSHVENSPCGEGLEALLDVD